MRAKLAPLNVPRAAGGHTSAEESFLATAAGLSLGCQLLPRKHGGFWDRLPSGIETASARWKIELLLEGYAFTPWSLEPWPPLRLLQLV